MRKENLIDLALFILRVVVGAVFVVHGAQKLFGMFGGIGLEGTTKIIEGVGLPIPNIFAAVWGFIEFAGGFFLIFGIVARWAASMVLATVIVHLWKINLAYCFSIQNGVIEHSLRLIGACVPLILLGAGSWSVWDV